MYLTRHLNSGELSEMILDSDQQHLQRTLDGLPECARAATERPDVFWDEQQERIRKRIAAVSMRTSKRTVIARAGAFGVILLATLLLYNHPERRPSRVQNDPDQELLVAVEQTVQNGIPRALEPAAMLADEIDNGSQPISTSNRVHKENRK
jgi:hypothetical protein